MNSAEHRANVLNAGFVDVGFGFANGSNYNNSGQETVVVAEYAAPFSAPAPKPVAAPPHVTPKATPTPTSSSSASAAPSASTSDTAAAPSTDNHTVQISVVDANNKPAAGIEVVLHSTPQTVYTDANGVATFSNIPTGDHTATVKTNGAESTTPLTLTSASATTKLTIAKPLPASNTTTNAALTPLPQHVSQLSVLTKGATPWVTLLLTILAIAGAIYLAVKHSLALHKYLRRGERYVVKHVLLDTTVVSFIGLCIILGHSVGSIL